MYIKKAQRPAIFTLRLSSPLQCLTSVFGMGTGDPLRYRHQTLSVREIIVLSKLNITTYLSLVKAKLKSYFFDFMIKS